MTQDKNPGRRWLIIIINSLLAVSILVFLFLERYRVQIVIDDAFGSKPVQLLDRLAGYFPQLPDKEITVIFVFNSTPSASQLEALEKLYKNSGAKANIAALFTSRFKIPFKISFPHHFSRNLTVKYKKNNIPVKNNFFVLLKNERIEFLEENSNASNTAFLVMKKINPSLRYNDLTLGAAALKARVIQKIKDGQPVLFSLEKEEYVKANAIFTNGAARVYFFHAPCSSCQLKAILSNIKTRQIIDAGEIVLVFSVMADSFELSRILQEQKISLPVYLDKNDEFDLFSVITDEKNNPVIIEPGEMNI